MFGIIDETAVTRLPLCPPHLRTKLIQPLPIKNGGVLRAVENLRAYMKAVLKHCETSAHNGNVAGRIVRSPPVHASLPIYTRFVGSNRARVIVASLSRALNTIGWRRCCGSNRAEAVRGPFSPASIQYRRSASTGAIKFAIALLHTTEPDYFFQCGGMLAVSDGGTAGDEERVDKLQGATRLARSQTAAGRRSLHATTR